MTTWNFVLSLVGSGLFSGVVVAIVNHLATRKVEADRRKYENRSRFLVECRDEYATLLRAADDIVSADPVKGALPRAAEDLNRHRMRVALIAPPEVWRHATKTVDTALAINKDRRTPKETPTTSTTGGVDQALMDQYKVEKVRFISAARRHIDPDAVDIEMDLGIGQASDAG